MNNITREEINKRLAILRESRLKDESYIITQTGRSPIAMCYCRPPVTQCSRTFVCSNCGTTGEIFWRSNERDSIDTFCEIIQQYRDAGIDAELLCNCESCVSQKGCNQYEVRIKTQDEKTWHISLPDVGGRNSWDDSTQYTTLLEYRLALDFLTFPFGDESFKKLTYENLYDKQHNFEYINGGFIKSPMDMALSKVLGLYIVYDLEEIHKNIDCIFDKFKIRSRIPNAYKMFDQTGKNEFTVWEYVKLMRDFYKTIGR